MKRLTVLVAILTIIFLTVQAVQATTIPSPSLKNIQLFPKDHVWNVPIDTLPVDSNSSKYVNSLGSSAKLAIYFGIPYNIVDQNTSKQYVTFNYPEYSDNVSYPIPDNAFIEREGSDKHLLIVDKDAKTLYELYHITKNSEGTWNASIGAVFNLSNYSLRSPTPKWSADAAGLSILPGLIKYEEVEQGEITHAIRFSSSAASTDFVWPARSYGHSSTQYPPYGQKFRLKSSFDICGYSPRNQVILKAMKKYGIIYADIGGGVRWNIHAATDSRWDKTEISALQNLVGSDFEAVDESSLMIDKDSGQARIISSNTSTESNDHDLPPENNILALLPLKLIEAIDNLINPSHTTEIVQNDTRVAETKTDYQC